MFRVKDTKKSFDVELKSFDAVLINLIKKGKSEEALSIIKGYSIEELIDKDGNHLLHVAAKHANLAIIYFLIESGCQVTITNLSGMTPFMIAVMYKNFEVANSLMYAHWELLSRQLTVPFDSESREQIRNSVRDDLLSNMRKKGFSSEQIGEVLAEVFSCRPSEVVKFHDPMMTKAYLQSTTESSWMYDIYHDRRFYDIDRGFIGMDRTLHEINKVFKIVMTKHDLQHIRVILDNAPCEKDQLLDEFCNYIVGHICYYHQSRSGRKFLKRIISWEVFTEKSLKYLEEKLYMSTVDVVDIILQYDFHSYFKTKYGRDVMASLFGCDDDITSLLKDKQINVEARGYDGKTPLHFAAQRGSIDNLRILLDRGADPNAFDEKQRTPLTIALLNEHCEIHVTYHCVKLLLLAGANPFLISDQFEETGYLEFQGVMIVNLLVAAQLIVYETLGQSIERSNTLLRNCYNQELESFMKECRQQLNELKSRQIRDTQLTMFTILGERLEKLACYISKEDLQVILTFIQCNEITLLSYYRDLLKKRAEDIVQIHSYRRRAIQVVCQFTGICDPHHLVVHKIVDYFSARDLQKFAIRQSQDLTLWTKAKRFLKLTKRRISRF